MPREGMESGVAAEEHVEEAWPKKRQAVIADISNSADDMARDVAEGRRSKEKAELGNVSFLRRVKRRIWDFNLADSFYRQRAVVQAREGISESESLYGQDDIDREAHKETIKSIVERFTSEYESKTIHHDVGEEKKVLGDEAYDDRQAARVVKALVEDYAVGRIDEDSFQEARGRALAAIYDLQPDAFEKGSMYADNLLEIAREARRSVEHYGALRDIDLDFEVIVGRAKAGVRTEAQYNTLDRIIDRLQSSKTGSAAVDLFGEKTVALGLSAAYTFIGGISRRVASSRALAIATFFGTAGISSAIAGARKNKELKDQRRQHAREMAQGKQFNPNAAPLRKEMEEFRYETRRAEDLMRSLNEGLQSLYQKEKGGVLELAGEVTPEKYQVALAALAEINARVEISDRHKIDLISHSSLEKVSTEQKDLDILRAKAETDLVNIHQQLQDQGIVPPSQSFSDVLNGLTDARRHAFVEGDGGMQERDRLFNKMKRKQVGLTMGKAFLTGALIGATAQEGLALVRESQEGLAESLIKGRGSYQGYQNAAGKTVYNYSGLQGLRHWIFGGWPEGAPAASAAGRQNVVFEDLHATFPKDCSIVPGPDGSFNVNVGNNEIVNVRLDANGNLPDDAKNALQAKGSNANGWMESVTGGKRTESVGLKEYLERHPDKTIRVSRSWYDNDTPKPIFDKNELKLLLGGIKGTGIDKDGNYVLNMKQMTPDGSYHDKLSVNAQELIKSGKAVLAISASQDTQGRVFTLNFNADGNVKIPPDSEAGRMFFETDAKGRAVFKGRFAEVAHFAGQQTKDGREIMRVLATHTAKGIDSVLDEVEDPAKRVPKLCIEKFGGPDVKSGPVGPIPPPEFEIAPPLFIPFLGKKHLEPTRSLITDYGYYGFDQNRRERHEIERSPTLRDNPDASLDHYAETETYLSKQDPEYLKEVERLAGTISPIKKECRLSVCIPVAGHQEGLNIYRTLENYTYQTANREDYEIVLFVNHPDKDESGIKVKPDNTLREIRRFKKDHPEMNVYIVYKVLPIAQARIGYIRKVLNDLTLYRQHRRGKDAPDLIMASNDADNKGIANQYIENFITKFEENPKVDAYLGQLDWDPEAYLRNPLIHVGTRIFQYLNVQSRRKGWYIDSSGANFAFRSSIYAAVNGYSTDIRIGEDSDLGAKIKEAREGAHEHDAIRYAGARVSRLYTSARRAEAAIKQGLSPIEQWDNGFGAFDDEVRKIRWENEGNGIDFEDQERLDRFVNTLEGLINRTAYRMRQWGGTAKDTGFQKALGWLGIKFEVIDDYSIKIINASRLLNGLKKYQTEAMDIRERKTGRRPTK